MVRCSPWFMLGMWDCYRSTCQNQVSRGSPRCYNQWYWDLVDNILFCFVFELQMKAVGYEEPSFIWVIKTSSCPLAVKNSWSIFKKLLRIRLDYIISLSFLKYYLCNYAFGGLHFCQWIVIWYFWISKNKFGPGYLLVKLNKNISITRNQATKQNINAG